MISSYYQRLNTALILFMIATAIQAGDATEKLKPAAGYQIKETDWCKVRIPETCKPGEELVVQVAFKDGAIQNPTKLHVDIHWFKGAKRAGVLKTSWPKPIKPGQDGPHEIKLMVKAKEGMTAIAVPIYISNGGWSEREKSTSIGVKVKH